MKFAGFNFQDDSVRKVDVNVAAFLTQFQEQVDAFAKDEDFAENLAKATNEQFRDMDRSRASAFSSAFWQSRDWWFNLQRVVPFLILELLKYQPKNADKLAKASKFWEKPFRWSPTGDPYKESAEKYLSVLKLLRDMLADCQKAAAAIGTEGKASVDVGKFEVFDGTGLDESTKLVHDALKQGTRAMTKLGLGAYCYGKVTILDSSKIAQRSSAFYVVQTDEVYVSPEMKGQEVRALCHELTHRIYNKLNLASRARSLYDTCSDRGLWVTGYAKTNAEENLCEMVSFAAVGKLPKDAEDLVRTAVPKIKLATSIMLACRWLAENRP